MELVAPAVVAPCAVACWVALVTPRLVQTDLTEHRLPNRLVMPGWLVSAAGLGTAWLLGGSFPLVALLSGLVAFGGALLLALGGGLGMGDVKLLLPLGIGLGLRGVEALLIAGIVAVLAGGVAGIVALVRHRSGKTRIAYGPWLLLGYWVGYLA